MGIKSTHQITREFAREVIMRKLYSLTDSQLADMAETAIGNIFQNYRIVDQIDKSQFEMYLDDIENLPEFNEKHLQ